MKIKIAQFGLGPIGLATLKLAATRPWVEVVGAVDIDPAKVGKKLSEFIPEELCGLARVHPSFEALCNSVKPDLVFHTAVSRLREALPQIEPMIGRGIAVVSSCEELVFPQFREPELAGRLDELCRQTGARVVGTGVNPGFVMDLLPVCLTGVNQSVESIEVRRIVNASTRRGPLQKKIGTGLPPEEFRRLFAEGKVGHAGLQESLAFIAHSLGWKLQRVQETGWPIIAEQAIRTEHVQVSPGETCGLHQRAEGESEGRVRLILDLKMYLDAPNPHDGIRVEGAPPLELVIEGGVAGDLATVSSLVNTAPRLLQARPGLRLMSELPLPCLA